MNYRRFRLVLITSADVNRGISCRRFDISGLSPGGGAANLAVLGCLDVVKQYDGD
jgi:hypothetical protein